MVRRRRARRSIAVDMTRAMLAFITQRNIREVGEDFD
jgi:hypothetical protein